MMNWTTEYIEEDDYVLIESDGHFTEEDNLAMLEDLIRQPYWKPGMNALFDCRKRDYGKDGLEYIRKVSRNFPKFNSALGAGKTALLMKSVEDFELAREFEILAGEETPTDLRIFLNEMLAVSWIKSHVILLEEI